MNAQPLVAKTYLSRSKLDWTDEAIDDFSSAASETMRLEGLLALRFTPTATSCS